MTRISQSLVIQAPAEFIFAQTQNYSVRNEWDSFHGQVVKLDGGTALAAGSRLRVKNKQGVAMEVEFIHFQPPQSAAITMLRGPGFLRQFSGSWVFRPLSEELTEVKFSYGFTTRWWTCPMLTERLFAWYFANVVKSRLAGLKRYCEAITKSRN